MQITSSFLLSVIICRKMNKHVSKLQKEASEARKQIEDSDSDSSESEEEGRSRRKNKPVDRPTEEQVTLLHRTPT